MSKRPPLALVFDEPAWIAAIRGNDPLTKVLAELVGKFGDDKVADALDALLRRLWQPESAPPNRSGRPPKWGDGKKLYAWLAVEGQWRADKQTNPKCKLQDSIRRKIDRLPRRGNGKWRVLHDKGAWWDYTSGSPELKPGPEGGRHLDLANVETARKYHRVGAALLAKMRPDVHAKWSELADQLARLIAARAGTKPTRK